MSGVANVKSDVLLALWDTLDKQGAKLGEWGGNGIAWRPDWRPHLRLLHAPALLLRGEPEFGGLIPAECAHEALTLKRDLRVITIASAGHDLHRDHFAATLAAIRGFNAL